MIKILKNLNKKQKVLIVFSIILICLQVWLELKMPDYMATITTLVETEGSKMADIIRNGSMMLLCALGSLTTSILTGYLLAYVTCNFSLNVRKNIFKKVEELSTHDIKEFSTSSLITRTTNDVTQIEMFLGMGLQLLIKSPITAIWAVTKILNKSWEWSMITGLAVIILLSVVGVLIFLVVPKFKIIQKLTDKLNNVTRENITGVRVVRAFNAEKYQENKFSNVNKELMNTHLYTQTRMAIMQPTMYLVLNGLTLTIYFVGAILIKNAMFANKLTLFGNMIVFSAYAMQVIASFLMLAMIFMILPRAEVSAKRINEVLEKEPSIKEGNFDGETKETGTVEFRDVSFRYPDADEYILKDIDFKAKKGETVAFIGMTGSGKSTLINLIPRLYDATVGEVLVDGVNVKEYKEAALNNKIGYVSQKAILFDGNVNFNVSFGESKKEITDKKIKEAIEIAQAKDFVEDMDDKYESHIASSGTNISGGQKQRLSIARAIARDPEIYIFDDSFSALDYKTDSILRKKLKEYTKDATVLIVAQRIGTIMNADNIIVLNNGEVAGRGTHKELLKTCKIYKEIALSQLTEEELENE